LTSDQDRLAGILEYSFETILLIIYVLHLPKNGYRKFREV
jgi:hypothetical protein